MKGFILWHNIIFKLSDELKDKVKKLLEDSGLEGKNANTHPT